MTFMMIIKEPIVVSMPKMVFNPTHNSINLEWARKLAMIVSQNYHMQGECEG